VDNPHRDRWRLFRGLDSGGLRVLLQNVRGRREGYSILKMNPVLSCKDISCHRENWNETGQSASIENVTASFDAGMVCEFDGPDAAGRGLLLSVLGLLEPADSGMVRVDGRDVVDLVDEELQRLRARTFGFLFSNPCLLPSFSLVENVAMPLFRICGLDTDVARERTIEALDFCGIAHRENQLAGSLAASTQQRAAFARALVHRPKILIALSPRGGDELFELATRTARELGLCVLWAGETDRPGAKAQRLLRIHNGRVVSDEFL
jgi:ABC-type lipoprotein export system ATPase subunit